MDRSTCTRSNPLELHVVSVARDDALNIVMIGGPVELYSQLGTVKKSLSLHFLSSISDYGVYHSLKFLDLAIMQIEINHSLLGND